MNCVLIVLSVLSLEGTGKRGTSTNTGIRAYGHTGIRAYGHTETREHEFFAHAPPGRKSEVGRAQGSKKHQYPRCKDCIFRLYIWQSFICSLNAEAA
jgi:hypothetical protein